MNSNIIFCNDVNRISIKALYYIGGYITYEVIVSTGAFSGSCSFCIAENTLEEYLLLINGMVDTLSGNVKICDTESDAYLNIFFENDMKLDMVGQLGGSYEENMLKFRCTVDQTLLQALRETLLTY